MHTGSICLGKSWGLRRMANEEGHFTMVALDQRPPIANLVAAKRGIAPSQVSFADMIAVHWPPVHRCLGYQFRHQNNRDLNTPYHP